MNLDNLSKSFQVWNQLNSNAFDSYICRTCGIVLDLVHYNKSYHQLERNILFENYIRHSVPATSSIWKKVVRSFDFFVYKLLCLNKKLFSGLNQILGIKAFGLLFNSLHVFPPFARGGGLYILPINSLKSSVFCWVGFCLFTVLK